MKFAILIVFVLALKPSFSQSQFGHWQYNKPNGWDETNQKNSVLTLTSPDKLSLILLMPPKPLNSTLSENFKMGWNEYVRDAFGIKFITSGTPQTTSDGLEMLVSGWAGNKDGVPILLYFYTIKNQQQTEYLIILNEGEAGYKIHEQEINEFLNTFQISTDPVSQPTSQVVVPWTSNSAKNNSPSVTSDIGTFSRKAPSGVYWALTTQLKMGWSISTSGTLNYGSTSANSIGKDLYFLVLFDDGQAYWWSFLPNKGLNQYSRTSQSFGMYNYTVAGTSGKIKTSNKEYDFSIHGKEILVDGEAYHPLPSVDAIALEGKWYRTDFDQEVKKGTYTFGYLTLTKDGHFSDTGMLEGWTGIKPGSGTYVIRDYTLILNFNDGRKDQLSFYSLQIPIIDHAFINSYDISLLK